MGSMRLTFAIYDLDCSGREARTVERALTTALGVRHAYVNPVTEMAYVAYDPALTDADHLIVAVARAGFRVGEARLR